MRVLRYSRYSLLLHTFTLVSLLPGKYDWKEGRLSGGAFSGKDDAFTQLLTDIYRRYALSNPLHSDIFPGVRKMEAEIVKMTLDLFHGDQDACGCVSDLVVVVVVVVVRVVAIIVFVKGEGNKHVS